MTRTIRLRIDAPCPPIPFRDCDYAATDDATHPDGCVGYGATPEQAVDDWLNEAGLRLHSFTWHGDAAAFVEVSG